MIIRIPADPNIPVDGRVEPGTAVYLRDGGSIGDRASIGVRGGDDYQNLYLSIAGGTVGSRVNFSGGTLDVSGGQIGDRFSIDTVLPVNISGGVFGDDFEFVRGVGQMSISGGRFGDDFRVNGGIVAEVSGGAFGDLFEIESTTRLTLVGGDFRFNGLPIAGLNAPGDMQPLANASVGDVTGVFADGTPFLFRAANHDRLWGGDAVRLRVVELPTVTPGLVPTLQQNSRWGVRGGEVLVLRSGDAAPDHFNAGHGGVVRVEQGAALGVNLEAVGATIHVERGAVGDRFEAFDGSEVTVIGGSIGRDAWGVRDVRFTLENSSIGQNFRVIDGGIIDASNTFIGNSFVLDQGAIVLNGGGIGNNFTATASDITIHGGKVGQRMRGANGSTVTMTGGELGADNMMSTLFLSGGVVGPQLGVGVLDITGGEFLVNGAAVAGLDLDGDHVNLALPAAPIVVSGTLEDGSPFLFSSADGDSLSRTGITLRRVALPSAAPGTIFASAGNVPSGIRGAQRLVADAGGVVPPNFNAGPGTHVRVEADGELGANFEAVGAVVEIAGGEARSEFDAFHGARVTVTGGGIDFLAQFVGSSLEVLGGVIGYNFSALENSQVRIADGVFGQNASFTDSTLQVDGGLVWPRLRLTRSVADFNGGEIGDQLTLNTSQARLTGGALGNNIALAASSLEVSGGTIGSIARLDSASSLHLFGLGFQLNGAPITGLQAGVPFLITGRDATLTGFLADGTPFSFDLALNNRGLVFDPSASITVTLVPEPPAFACWFVLAASLAGLLWRGGVVN